MSDQPTKFHCAGCSKNYDTEAEVVACSTVHAEASQADNQRAERAQAIARRAVFE